MVRNGDSRNADTASQMEMMWKAEIVMADDIAIDIRGLTKSFDGSIAVNDVTFTVRRGEVFGFMGHNGAGKTTTLRMLLSLLRPTKGSASVMGHDIVEESIAIRRVAGFLPGDYALPGEMTAGDKFSARRRNKPRSLIDPASGALPKSPVSLSPGDEIPHIFTRKPRLQLENFAINGAKRLLQQNRHCSDVLARHDSVRFRMHRRQSASKT